MKRVFRTAVFLFGLLLALAPQAAAAERATFVVLPFSIQGPDGFAYLERAIPPMFNSRLYWQGHLEPAVHDLPASQKAVSSEADAEKLRLQYKADYVIWGSVTVIGDECSLDVRVRDKAGKVWPQSRSAKTNQFIPAVNAVIDTMNREVFGRTATASSSGSASQQQQDSGRINQMNPDLVVNETSNKEIYLNPQFRYSGNSDMDSSRLRSQSLPFASIGMEVIDADGDGKNEIFILADHTLYAYRFGPDKLQQIGEFKFPMTSECLNIRSLDRSTGRPWLIVNMVDSKGSPVAVILTFDGKNFKEEMKNIRYFLNVVKLPPDYRPVLVGQQAQPPKLFKPGVYEMIKSGDSLSHSKRLDLPKDANALNFAYLPAGRGDDNQEKIILYSESETLRVYTAKGARLSESDEKYSGSAKGLEVDPSMPGMGQEKVTIRGMFYMPMRILPVDLEKDGNYEIIVNKPISTASTIFDRYRFFPQSEIHALFWDGLGMNLQWKTRRIKGSMVDYAIADGNNDGIQDLVTCINSHPGALGVQGRKTIVVLYPLDLGQANPNTPSDQDDFFD